MDKGATVVSAGAAEVAMSYRNDIPGDAGLCIQVYAEVDGRDTELLRFDCFANAPHYHYGPEQNNERLMLDATRGRRSARLGAGTFRAGPPGAHDRASRVRDGRGVAR